jgi:hypothetical protein
MPRSLCETCRHLRIVVTPKGSRFLLCRLHASDPVYPKYPAQPIVRCAGPESVPIPPVGDARFSAHWRSAPI